MSRPTVIRTHDVDVGPHRLRVHESGAPPAPAVLWLHGSGPGVSALSNWEQLLTALAPAFHNVAPDLLGFGASSHPDPAPRGIHAYGQLRARTLLDLLDALGLDRVHVVGNSMGGMIALRMAQQQPERFDRIVLMGCGGTPAPFTPDLGRLIRFYDDPTPATMRELLLSFIDDTSVFAGRLDEIAADRVVQATRPEVRRSHEATFDLQAGPSATFTPDDLAALPHETLVVHGREDRIIPVEASYFLSTHLPNAQLHVLPHAGHWVQIEQVDRFASLATAFLTEKH